MVKDSIIYQQNEQLLLTSGTEHKWDHNLSWWNTRSWI